MSELYFQTKLYEINSWRILRFPEQVSKELPSRGMVMVNGSMNGVYLEAPLEPDGVGSHWFKVSDALALQTKVGPGDTVSLLVEPLKLWPEPEVPLDIIKAFTESDLIKQWNGITTKARWEWIRWIRFTNNSATRQKRITVACSMLESGKKRPCCFDQSRCTEPYVSKNGILLALQ